VTSRKRILFVDDESQVRDAVQRSLRPYAQQWEQVFVPGARQALDYLSECAVDVLVTDMTMPEMSGAELLSAVAEQHPDIVRIVLAPPADQPLVMGCATLTHQYLTRPCEGDVLRDAIERALDLDQSVRRERIARLVARMDSMPSLPDLYLQLVEKVQDPECSIDDVGELIARDISMTARILKLVNSAYFGLRRRVSSAQEAVNYAGIDTVKALVLSISAFAQFERRELGGVTLESLWNHSLLTAGCAKIVARSEGASARGVDDAFVAGMLHDVGKLALGANFGAIYAEVVARAAEMPDGLLGAEAAEFGADHAEIGGHLLALWGLPATVVDAVAWHHDPAGCPEKEFGPLACVHAANVWAHEGHATHWLRLAEDYYASLSLAHRVPVWRQACLDTDTTRASA
jgi:HD-like signal output (HDOD) protein/CheY-like chemotaxis protein